MLRKMYIEARLFWDALKNVPGAVDDFFYSAVTVVWVSGTAIVMIWLLLMDS